MDRSSTARTPCTDGGWMMPLAPETYDRRIALSQEEKDALAEIARLSPTAHISPAYRPAAHVLSRFARPLYDCYALRRDDADGFSRFLRSSSSE